MADTRKGIEGDIFDGARPDMLIKKRRRFRRVLVDVDTQFDLMYSDQLRSFPFGPPGGTNHTAEGLLCRIRRLMAWARVRGVPVISMSLSQRSDQYDVKNPLSSFCREGEAGQSKIHFTVLPSHVMFGPENRLDLPVNLLATYQQVIFETRLFDPFTQPRADRLLSELKADEYVVFGMGLEWGIKATVLGLLAREKKVRILRDAVGGYGGESVMAYRQLEAKGARMIETTKLTGNSHLRGTGSSARASQRILMSVRSH